MSQPEILHSPWPLIYEHIDSSTYDHHHHHQDIEPYSFTMVDHVGDDYGIIMDDHVEHDYEFNTLLSTPENSTLSEISIFTNNHIQFPIDEETLELPSLMELEFFDSLLSPQICNIQEHEYHEESEGSFPSQNFPDNLEGYSSNPIGDNCKMAASVTYDNSPSQNTLYDAWSPTVSMKSDFSSIQQSLILPQENMEIENQVSLPHLMEAHGEALEKGQKALAEVNLKCISQKVTTPIGDSLETLAFYLAQEVTNHGDYLKGEAYKNFQAAFKVFYQGNLVAKIAHFSAISSILEAAMLVDCDEIHIIDYCFGNGIQWPFLLDTVSKMNKRLKLTSIKWSDENSECVWNFEDTKRELYEYAKSCGLILKVEEKELEELISEIKIMNKRGGKKEFLAFNLMTGLPHMGMVRSRRKHAYEFLKVAEDLIKNYGSTGIITFGDGDAFEKLKNSLNFMSFFEGNLVHYKALLESIESQFSEKFSEARIACEVLFVAPCISSLDWLQTWEEMKSDGYVKDEISLEGGRLSKNVLLEVREMLRGNDNSYQARIEGENENELVLEWKGTQILRFSIWKN